MNYKFIWGSYADYFYEKEKRILKIFPAEQSTVMYLIIEGLPEDVAREVLKNHPRNAQAVLDQLKTYSHVKRPNTAFGGNQRQARGENRYTNEFQPKSSSVPRPAKRSFTVKQATVSEEGQSQR